MIKAIIAGIWSVALLSGSLILFGGMNGDNADGGKDAAAKLEYIKLDTMSITIIRDNVLQGYLILDVGFEFEAAKRVNLTAPAELVLMDAINRRVFTDKEIDIERLEQFDFISFKEKVKEAVNNKVGDSFASEVLIERIDFISYEEIRDKKLRG